MAIEPQTKPRTAVVEFGLAIGLPDPPPARRARQALAASLMRGVFGPSAEVVAWKNPNAFMLKFLRERGLTPAERRKSWFVGKDWIVRLSVKCVEGEVTELRLPKTTIPLAATRSLPAEPRGT